MTMDQYDIYYKEALKIPDVLSKNVSQNMTVIKSYIKARILLSKTKR